jgi:cytochrome c-type biogenesis protein CcmH
VNRVLPLLAAFLLLAPAAWAQEPRASLPDIEDEVMCPICGTLLELSDAPQAERQRELIRGLIADGRSKKEIKDALVAEYGPDVLATPGGEGFDLAAWLVPGLAITLAIVALALAMRRWRRPSLDGRAPTEKPRPADSDRLDADLRRYDL